MATGELLRWDMEMDSLERELREKLAWTAIRSYRRGHVAAAGGNVSARVPGRDEVLITPTGVSLELTTIDNIVKVDINANQIDGHPTCKPSKETGFHCAVYRTRPEVNAIVHVHPPYCTAFSNRYEELPLVTVSASVGLKAVPIIDVALSGSAELRGFVEDAFRMNPMAKAVMMRAHGVIAAGSDLVNAYDIADLVENTAKIAFLTQGFGVSMDDAVEVAFRPVPGGRPLPAGAVE